MKMFENNNYNKATGIFFKEQTIKSLKSAIKKFENKELKFDKKFIIDHANIFDEKNFNKKIKKIVNKEMLLTAVYKFVIMWSRRCLDGVCDDVRLSMVNSYYDKTDRYYFLS